jgi:hypothetical protein
MRTRTFFLAASFTLTMLMSAFWTCGGAYAQQSGAEKKPTGGSLIIPAPQPPFGSVIGRVAHDSKSDFPKSVTAPKGAHSLVAGR